MTALTRLFNDRPLRLVAATVVLALAGGGMALGVQAAAPHGGGFGGPMMMGGPGHIEQMLDAVGATADQRSQIKTIMTATHADMRAQHEAGKALRDQMMQLFTQPSVDARAAESLRQQMLTQHDQSSKRMMQAMLDVSRVLTADQRKQLGDQMAQRHALMERQRAERNALDKPATR